MGSKARAWRMAELRAPLRRRFSRFQVDTRILARVRAGRRGGEMAPTPTAFLRRVLEYSHAALVERRQDAALVQGGVSKASVRKK